MGQANQRGTKSERRQMAIERNKQLDAQLPKDSPFSKIIKKHGTQRLATRLTAAGYISTPKAGL